MREAIERDEGWFTAVCPCDVATETSAIKQRVRIEIGELWLARKLDSTDDPDFATRVRESVREAFAESSRGDASGAPRRVSRLFYLGTGTAAIAAALVLSWMGLFSPGPVAKRGASETIETSYVDAFDQYESDDWDTSLDALSDEFDSVASGSNDWDTGSTDGWFEIDGEDRSTDG